MLFRCLEKACEEESNKNKEKNSDLIGKQGLNLVILNFELPSALCYALGELFKK